VRRTPPPDIREVKAIEDYRERFYVDPHKKLKLEKLDPAYTGEHESEADAAPETAHYLRRLCDLQGVFSADGRWALLIVLQGLDAAGKDGTVAHVMSAFSPQSASVSAFKVPTVEERAHDFLWRVHPHAPAKGSIAIFNRSHYEDFLVPAVHRTLDEEACLKRIKDIRAFEKLLFHAGTRIVKFFLHIGKREQLDRFAHRLDDPSRNWKISESDYTERAYWDDYIEAYDDVLRATSTEHAPWYVIPADRKWFRNLAVSQIVSGAIEDLHPRYPKPSVDLDEIRRRYHEEAAAE